MMSDEDSFDYYDDGFEQSLLTVTDIQRYIVDPVFLQQTGLTDPYAYDAYDLTVADSRRRVRVVLSTSLDHLVAKRKIKVGSRVRLTSVKVRYDETRVNGPGIPVVEDLTVVSQHHAAAIDDLNMLPWYPENDVADTCHPVASRRGYYMDLWSNTDVANTADDFQVQASGSLGNVSSPDLYSVREIAAHWQTLRASRPRLLLRVMRRSKLFHYARPSKTDRWPFQLHLVVGDETGCCMAVFWNVMAPRYLNFLQEGSVILVRNFTVKPRFQVAEHPLWVPPGHTWHDIDININAHNPLAEVTLIDERDVEDLHDVRLPSLTTNFISRRELRYIPDGYMCDIAGVVTFVGDVQREKAKGKSGLSSGGFWQKRWLHVVDHSSNLPFVVQLYRGVQKQEFEDGGLMTGAFIVCRNMRVVRGLDSVQSSREPRHVYVTSSKETQLYVSEVDEDVDYPFPDDTMLTSARRFARARSQDRVTHRGSLWRMLFSFPLQPTSFEAFTMQHEKLELTPCSGWPALVDSLTYRESAQIAVQAALLDVKFHPGHARIRRSKRTHTSQNQQNQQVTSTSGATAEDGTVYLGYKYTPLADDAESRPEGMTNMNEDDCFTFQWRGLNADIVLNTVRPCNLRSCPSNLTLHALLSGSCDARPGEATVDVREDVARRLEESANFRSVASLTRYLVLLDLYCVDGQTAVMGVNRAFPLRGH
ncbi:RPA-related protein RADX-like [Babylonia areolata]|uniref:RPA-related protein RADX-like n=1 Tax=Babylonia areolata TaxID=304850 RepID=UPI003FD6B63C